MQGSMFPPSLSNCLKRLGKCNGFACVGTTLLVLARKKHLPSPFATWEWLFGKSFRFWRAGNVQFSKRTQGGFTLLELLVAMAVFMIIATAALGIYSFSLKAYQRSIEASRMQGEMVLIMEVLTKRIRSSQVNYTWYGGSVDCPQDPKECSTLALIDQDGVNYFIRAENGNVEIDAGGTGTYRVFNSSRVAVTGLRFSIFPVNNPFSPSTPPTSQPRVVVNLTVTPKGKIEPVQVIEQSVPQRSGI